MKERITAAFIDCYRYREVLANILSQDLKVKYKRTAFGYLWSLLNPVLQLVVLSVVFSHITRLGMKNYTLFLFSGLIAWSFFQNALTTGSTCLLENENFIKKIYLPKLIFPLSRTLLRLVDFLLALFALSLIGAFLGFPLRATVALLPAAVLILFFFSLGLTMIVSVATVYFRDVQYLLGIALQLLYFLTPILYPVSALPAHYHKYVVWNPVYSVLVLFQRLIYEGVLPSLSEWGVAIGLAFMTLAVGVTVLTALDEDIVFRM